MKIEALGHVVLRVTDRACNTGSFPAVLPPVAGTTAHAGVSIRYLAGLPPLTAVAPGGPATVFVDARQHGYAWALRRAGADTVLASGGSRAVALHIALPSHAASFEKIDQLLTKVEGHKKLADLCASLAPPRPRAKQPALLRRAAELYEADGGADDRIIEINQQILRIEPQDEKTRERLEARFLKANRHRDIARLLEQALTADPPPGDAYALQARGRLIELYAGQLREPECRRVPQRRCDAKQVPGTDDGGDFAKIGLDADELLAERIRQRRGESFDS